MFQKKKMSKIRRHTTSKYIENKAAIAFIIMFLCICHLYSANHSYGICV